MSSTHDERRDPGREDERVEGREPSDRAKDHTDAPRAKAKGREGFGFGALAIFRRVRDASRSIRRPLKPAVNAILIPVAAFFIYLFVAFTNRTVRFEVIGPRHDLRMREKGEAAVFAFYHGRLFSMFRMFRGDCIAMLVALGDIGDVITMVGRLFGHDPMRGARTGRAVGGLAELIHAVRKGRNAAFAIDGPRGPREIVKPGAVFVAQKTGCALIPITTASRSKWNLGIWDRHEIPWPFTKTVALMGEPIYLPRRATPEEFEAAMQRLQDSLVAITASAADKVRRYS